MLVLIIAAVGLGVGCWLLLVGLVPPKLTLAQQMARAQAANHFARNVTVPREDRLAARLGVRAAGWLARVGLPSAKVRAQLALLDRDLTPLLAQKVGTACFGLMLPAASLTVLTLAGICVPLAVPAVVGLVLGGTLFFLPDVALIGEVERFRAEARMSVRLFLDQAVMALAGGAGIEQALIAAAADGRGHTLGLIRQALADAQLRREAAWPHLDALGRRLGVRELSELAAACVLAGAEGAKVRVSIGAKARSMRGQEFAVHLEAAEAATARLAVPGGLLGMSVVCFLIYAALAAAARQM
jgi:tight adherence protein C